MPDPDTQLYQQTIIEHSRAPKNFGPLENASHHAEGYNPICGDHIHLYLLITDNTIRSFHFDGDCCAVCKASASLMTEALKEQSVEVFDDVLQSFLKLVDPKVRLSDVRIPDALRIFAGIREYPSRVHCATLPWKTAANAINNQSTITSTENSA